MKLTAITDEISQDFEHALDVLKEYGSDSAELRGLWDINVVDLSDDDVFRAARMLDERGMSVCCIASPLFKCELDDTSGGDTGPTHLAKTRGMSQQMELIDRCAWLADMFKTRLIRIFSFWKRGALTDDIERRIVEILAEGATRAAKEGIVLCLENEHSCYLGTGEETARVIEKVDSPALRAVWDPGNAFCAGEVPYPDGYEAMKPFIAHVHLKDAVMTDGKHKFVVMGRGSIDYVGQFKALKADGYAGYLSLETHYRPPSGSAEEGSRECLESIRTMLADL